MLHWWNLHASFEDLNDLSVNKMTYMDGKRKIELIHFRQNKNMKDDDSF